MGLGLGLASKLDHGIGRGEVLGAAEWDVTVSGGGEMPVLLARCLSSADATAEAAEMERGRAASELMLRLQVAEEEALYVTTQLQRVAVEQTQGCVVKVIRELARATKAEARCVAALNRASNGLGRVTDFMSAQTDQEGVVGALQGVLESRYMAEGRVDDLRRDVSRARGRQRLATLKILEPKLADATAKLRFLLRSTQYCTALASARDMLIYLPELAVKFPVLDPFRGTAAAQEGLRERDFSEYGGVKPLLVQDGSGGACNHLGGHVLLKATCCPPVQQARVKAGEEECVLKEVAVEDEQRLRREMHTLRRLNHPNIISLRAICRQRVPTRYFLELPYCPHNLQQWLVARDEVPESKEERYLAVTDLLKAVLEGMESLHQNGVLHRDLKPENILVTREGVPVIANFETSVSVDDPLNVNAAAMVVSSSGYSAPEVVSEGYSQASDMYSFGLMVAQALLGLRVAPAEIPGAVRELAVVRGGGKGVTSISELDKEQLGVLNQLLSPDAGRRPSATILLQSTLLRSRPRVRTCVICLADDIPLLEGLECGGGGGGGVMNHQPREGVAADAVHFACKSCFSAYVTSQSEEELQKLEHRGGNVMCPKWLSLECTAPAYPDAKVAELCSPAVFALYVGQRVRLAELKLASEMARDHAKKLEAELARLGQMDERTRRVDTTAAQVRELLNNACPRCKAVFVDFDGCWALRCNGCNAAFCGWCLVDCGNDAHQHVRNCSRKNDGGQEYGGTQAQWVKASRGRFRKNVNILLDSVVARDGASIAADAARAVARELTDMGMSDIVNRYDLSGPGGARGAIAAPAKWGCYLGY